jgi:hypothetical protein
MRTFTSQVEFILCTNNDKYDNELCDTLRTGNNSTQLGQKVAQLVYVGIGHE